MHGAFPVEAITIPPLNVIAYHSAPRDSKHWIVSQIMKDGIAYPVVTGLDKQDAKILAVAINTVLGRQDGGIGGVKPGDKYKWWENYSCIESVQEVICELVVEIMSSGVSDATKQRFNNTGEMVEVMGNAVLLWNTDSTTLPAYDPVARTYGSPRTHLSRWVFTIGGGGEGLVKKTIPEVWVQQEFEK